MSPVRYVERIVEQVHKRVPEAKLEMTDERLPRWNLANRVAWLEYDPTGKLLMSGTTGDGSTVSRRHKRDESASDTAEIIAEYLVEPAAQKE